MKIENELYEKMVKIADDILGYGTVTNSMKKPYLWACPFCNEDLVEDNGRYIEMDDIPHEEDCLYMEAKKELEK